MARWAVDGAVGRGQRAEERRKVMARLSSARRRYLDAHLGSEDGSEDPFCHLIEAGYFGRERIGGGHGAAVGKDDDEYDPVEPRIFDEVDGALPQRIRHRKRKESATFVDTARHGPEWPAGWHQQHVAAAKRQVARVTCDLAAQGFENTALLGSPPCNPRQ